MPIIDLYRDMVSLRKLVYERILDRQIVGNSSTRAVSNLFDGFAGIKPILAFRNNQHDDLASDKWLGQIHGIIDDAHVVP